MAEYVIITPAHNEETFIERTLESVVQQTIRPVQWIVVDDASNDRTNEIVARYARSHSFIKLLSHQRAPGRNFGNKVAAFNFGLNSIDFDSYRYIGNLDADISIEPDYFRNILSHLEADQNLGLTGGMVCSRINGEFVSQEVALDSVAGAVQLFRRECFEEIGGYAALPYGGIDAMAEITARMKGWKVRTIPDQEVLEHRQTGTATDRVLVSRIKEGRRFHSLGYGLCFYFIRCLYRTKEHPRILGSLAALAGFVYALITRDPVRLSPEVVRYLRSEQRKRLRHLVQWPRRKIPTGPLQGDNLAV